MTDEAHGADEGKSSSQLPPYTAFQSLKSGLAVLYEHVIPTRIDRSVWGNKFSGSVASQVLTALRFLRLIDQDGVPTKHLRPLVESMGDKAEWATQLGVVLRAAYEPIFSLDLEKATASQFYERFRVVYGADGETGRKCVTFFLNAAREADIPVSPFLTVSAKPRTTGTIRRKVRLRRTSDEAAPSDDMPTPPESHGAHSAGSMTDKLLQKFPEFDPSWPDEIKAKWFAAFGELMDRTKS
jgi:hypothetical protein